MLSHPFAALLISSFCLEQRCAIYGPQCKILLLGKDTKSFYPLFNNSIFKARNGLNVESICNKRKFAL